MSPTNCSNNGSTIASIESAPSSSGYLIDKQSSVLSPSVASQSATPQFASSLRQVAISPVSFKNDTELLTVDELIYRIKTLETKNRKLLFENGCLIKDVNSNLANVQLIRHQMLELKKDNNELRDLCCYLDDERTRAKEIAKDFGDRMSKVLKKEINNYNMKLQQLESKQFELVKENYELKQLCLLLDKAMINKTTDKQPITREPNGLIDDKNGETTRNEHEFRRTNNKDATGESVKRKSLLNHKVLNYIKLLESKLDLYEQNRRLFMDRLANLASSGGQPLPIEELEKFEFINVKELKADRPDELNRAMQILCIERSLDDQPDLNSGGGDAFTDHKLTATADQSSGKMFDDSSLNSSFISDEQRTIIKQLCSAAYRKIEDDE